MPILDVGEAIADRDKIGRVSDYDGHYHSIVVGRQRVVVRVFIDTDQLLELMAGRAANNLRSNRAIELGGIVTAHVTAREDLDGEHGASEG